MAIRPNNKSCVAWANAPDAVTNEATNDGSTYYGSSSLLLGATALYGRTIVAYSIAQVGRDNDFSL